ncbi:helix-turn-helix domain-containing protein [Enterococcus sp. LJL98]
MERSIIHHRIINLREKKDWSQTKLAKKMGISKSTMSKIESGTRKITADELITLTNIFGVTSDYLLGLNDYPLETMKNIPYDLEALLNSKVQLKYAEQYHLSEAEKKFFNDILSGHFSLMEQLKQEFGQSG